MRIRKSPLKFTFDAEFSQLGLNEVCFAILFNIDNNLILPMEFQKKYDNIVEKLLEKEKDDLQSKNIENGYIQLIMNLKRSVKKFPPSAVALTNIMQKKEAAIHISPCVDIYNMYSLETRLSIGAHDLDKINGDINFRISKGNEVFFPIGGGQKKTSQGDYIYSDSDNVLAWLDSRDSELVKISTTTRNVVLIVQGNKYTNSDYRLNILNKICSDIKKVCGGSFSIGYSEISSGKVNYI